MKRLVFCSACLAAVLLIAQAQERRRDQHPLAELTKALQRFAEKKLKDGVAAQARSLKFAGDDPETARARSVSWTPAQWAQWLNDLQPLVGEEGRSKAEAAMLAGARNFHIKIGRKDIHSGELIRSPEEVWPLLEAGDNLYLNNGSTWHTSLLIAADNGTGNLNFLEKGRQEAGLLDLWPKRISAWMGWSEKNGDYKLLPSQWGDQEYIAVIVPFRVVKADVKEVIILRPISFAEMLVQSVLKKEGAAAAGATAFALGEQLWKSSELHHIAAANQLFRNATTYWEKAKEPALARKARLRDLATLWLGGYGMSVVRMSEDTPDPVEESRVREVGKATLEKAAAMEKELGVEEFERSVSGYLYLRLAQAAREIDAEKAMDYLAKAFAATMPLTDSEKAFATGLRAFLKSQKGDVAGAKADIDELEKLLIAEETSLNAAAKAAFGSEKSIDPLVRPDLFMRAKDWNLHRQIFLQMRQRFPKE